MSLFTSKSVHLVDGFSVDIERHKCSFILLSFYRELLLPIIFISLFFLHDLTIGSYFGFKRVPLLYLTNGRYRLFWLVIAFAHEVEVKAFVTLEFVG